jgi:hypothetical protein
MALPWIKAVGLVRALLPVVGPPVLRILKKQLQPRSSDQVDQRPSSDDLLLALHQDLQVLTAQLEQLHLHTTQLQSHVRRASWLSLVAIGLALIAIGIAAFT